MISEAGWLSIDMPGKEDASQHRQTVTQRPGQDTALKSNSSSLESMKGKKSLHKCQR